VKRDDASMAAPWFVYVLASTRLSRTYVGISTDPARRLAQHNGELPGGARTTRAGRPWWVAAEYGPYLGRGEALRAERAVKRLRGRSRFSWTPDPLETEIQKRSVDEPRSADRPSRSRADRPRSA
jgi:predicted GIY-YIG superfamily endonuclease